MVVEHHLVYDSEPSPQTGVKGKLWLQWGSYISFQPGLCSFFSTFFKYIYEIILHSHSVHVVFYPLGDAVFSVIYGRGLFVLFCFFIQAYFS